MKFEKRGVFLFSETSHTQGHMGNGRRKTQLVGSNEAASSSFLTATYAGALYGHGAHIRAYSVTPI
jgi:hypothetical protein